MKIREVQFQHIRGFGAPLRRIKFTDADTDLVRPLSVIVGSNGSGKSTLFQVIEGLLSYALELVEDRPITHEIREQGYAAMQVSDFDRSAPSALSKGIWIALGRKDRAPPAYDKLADQICRIEQRGERGKPFVRLGAKAALNKWVGDMTRGPGSLSDGVLFFPHNRWIEHVQQGAIESPSQEKPWLFHFSAESGWAGSLSQLWVWQNYLDLEAARDGGKNLLKFVQPIESILGRGRTVVIKEGHVRIREPSGRTIELHQLPSGEQQILTLFGEIVRRLRPGAVLLIDEVEISLHPALQRAVVAHLRKLAREHDLQVLVTTHSMEIVRSVAPNEIVNLDDMVMAEQQGAVP